MPSGRAWPRLTPGDLDFGAFIGNYFGLGVYPKLALDIINPALNLILNNMGVLQTLSLNFSLMAIFPEIALIALAILALILEFVLKNKRAIAWLIIFSLSAILLYLCQVPALNMSLFSGMLVLDSFTLFCKIISVFIAIMVMLVSLDYPEIPENYRVEFYSLLLLSTAAMMFLGGTNNLLMIYLGIEFLGLISYIIAAYWRGNLKSSESGLKYFLIGTASSITMLYGISLLYGVTGSLDLGRSTRFCQAAARIPRRSP